MYEKVGIVLVKTGTNDAKENEEIAKSILDTGRVGDLVYFGLFNDQTLMFIKKDNIRGIEGIARLGVRLRRNLEVLSLPLTCFFNMTTDHTTIEEITNGQD